MENGLRLEVVTPEKVVVSQEVDYVSAPGVEGEFGVLPNHVPLLAALKIGNIMYRKDGLHHYVFIAHGLAEVSNNTVTILADISEQAADIDTTRAEAARERARRALAEKLEAHDYNEANLALQKALSRLQTTEMAKAAGTLTKKE